MFGLGKLVRYWGRYKGRYRGRYWGRYWGMYRGRYRGMYRGRYWGKYRGRSNPAPVLDEVYCSSLLFLRDILSDQEFLVDSGASVSVGHVSSLYFFPVAPTPRFTLGTSSWLWYPCPCWGGFPPALQPSSLQQRLMGCSCWLPWVRHQLSFSGSCSSLLQCILPLCPSVCPETTLSLPGHPFFWWNHSLRTPQWCLS